MKNNKLFITRSLKKFLVRVLMPFALLIISSCEKANECVLADDWGNNEDITVVVNPKNEYTNAGIYAAQNEPLYIKTTGNIDICPDTKYYGPNDIKSTVGGWQNSGYPVKSGTRFSIALEDGTGYNDINGCDGDRPPGETRCVGGRGLYALIVAKGCNPNSSECGVSDGSGRDPSDRYYYPNKFYYADKQFFELYDNKSNGDGAAGFFGRAPIDGVIWFKYARSANVRSVDTKGENKKSPWRGKYDCAAHGDIACIVESTSEWVNESYSKNSGGYGISIASGCPGIYGQYMETKFVAPEYIVTTDVGDGTKIQTLSKSTPQGINMDPAAGIVSPMGVYDSKVPASGQIWLKINDNVVNANHPVPTYEDNIGEYKVRIKTTKLDSGFSEFLNKLINPIKDTVFGVCLEDRNMRSADCPESAWRDGVMKRMYTNLLGNSGIGGQNAFVGSVRAALVLYISLYSIAFMFGMINDPHRNFMMNLVRVAVIEQMLSPGSWDFFNMYFFPLFVNGMNELIGIMSGGFSGAVSSVLVDPTTGIPIVDNTNQPIQTVGDPFAFVNLTLSKFLNNETWIKMWGLISMSVLGFLYFILILTGMFFFVIAVFEAAILYIMSIITLGFLIGLTPIFISFMLFTRTRDIFDKWINNLLNFTLQPVMMITVLSIFNVFVYSALYQVLYFDVCWKCLVEIAMPVPKLPDIKLCLFSTYQISEHSDLASDIANVNIGSDGSSRSAGVSFFVILIFLIVTNAMWRVASWAMAIAAEITTEQTSASLANIVKRTTDAIKGAGSMAASGGFKGATKAIGKMRNRK